MQQKMMELRPELSRLYAVSLQGEDVPVYHTAEADYASLVVCDDAPAAGAGCRYAKTLSGW